MPPKKGKVVMTPAQFAARKAYWDNMFTNATSKALADAPAKAAAKQLAAQRALADKLLHEAIGRKFRGFGVGGPDATSAAAAGGSSPGGVAESFAASGGSEAGDGEERRKQLAAAQVAEIQEQLALGSALYLDSDDDPMTIHPEDDDDDGDGYDDDDDGGYGGDDGGDGAFAETMQLEEYRDEDRASAHQPAPKPTWSLVGRVPERFRNANDSCWLAVLLQLLLYLRSIDDTLRTGSVAIAEALYDFGAGRLSPADLLTWIRACLVEGGYMAAPIGGATQYDTSELLLNLVSGNVAGGSLLSGDTLAGGLGAAFKFNFGCVLSICKSLDFCSKGHVKDGARKSHDVWTLPLCVPPEDAAADGGCSVAKLIEQKLDYRVETYKCAHCYCKEHAEKVKCSQCVWQSYTEKWDLRNSTATGAAPALFLLSINRGYGDDGAKLLTHVYLDETILVSFRDAEGNVRKHEYALVAVLVHVGDTEGAGHNLLYLLEKRMESSDGETLTGVWVRFDDTVRGSEPEPQRHPLNEAKVGGIRLGSLANAVVYRRKPVEGAAERATPVRADSPPAGSAASSAAVLPNSPTAESDPTSAPATATATASASASASTRPESPPEVRLAFPEPPIWCTAHWHARLDCPTPHAHTHDPHTHTHDKRAHARTPARTHPPPPHAHTLAHTCARPRPVPLSAGRRRCRRACG